MPWEQAGAASRAPGNSLRHALELHRLARRQLCHHDLEHLRATKLSTAGNLHDNMLATPLSTCRHPHSNSIAHSSANQRLQA